MLGLFDKSHKIKGTVVLMPKSVLDINDLNSVKNGGVGGVVSGIFGAVADVTGQIVDTATAIFSRNVSFKLISATSTDGLFLISSHCFSLPCLVAYTFFFLRYF